MIANNGRRANLNDCSQQLAFPYIKMREAIPGEPALSCWPPAHAPTRIGDGGIRVRGRQEASSRGDDMKADIGILGIALSFFVNHSIHCFAQSGGDTRVPAANPSRMVRFVADAVV